MKKLLLPAFVAMLLSAPASAQVHMHSVPHSTTHYDNVQHGNHFHTVPHTTTHFDQVLHNGPDYIPHTTTHFDNVQHGNHFHTVPHTTTHFHQTYPSVGSGIISPSITNVIPSSQGFFPSSPSVITNSPNSIPGGGNVITTPPPQTVVSKPVVNESSGNVIPNSVVPASATGPGRTIVLANPAASGGSVKYSLNEFSYTIKPGESQTLNLDRNWTIAFDNGLGRRVNYRLNDGEYRFTVSPQRGWDVEKVEDAPPAAPAAPAAAAAPAADANAIPKL